MSRIINKSRSGFLKNRNIMDGIMALHEILHDTRIRKKDGLVLKLDFEKAYNNSTGNSCLNVSGKGVLVISGVNGLRL